MLKKTIVILSLLSTAAFGYSIQYLQNNASTLSGYPSAYYLNSSNQNAGTLPSARLTGTYSGITKLGTLSTLNVTGALKAGGGITGTLATADQPNVTHLGSLSTLNVTGALKGSTLFLSSTLDVTGNAVITGSLRVVGSILGTLATADQPNITHTGTLSTLNVTGALKGTLATADQPNITHVGTLTTLNVTGALNAGGGITGTLSTADQPNVTHTGTLTTLNVTGALKSNGGIYGTLQTASQPNITQTGTLSTLNVLGDLKATIATADQPNITHVGTLSTLNVTGAVKSNGGIYGTIQTASQPNITQTGTLVTLNVSGDLKSSTLRTSGAIYTGAIQALDSSGIAFKASSGCTVATVDGGGSCSITSGALTATVNLISPAILAYSSAGVSIKDDSGIVGMHVRDGGNVGIGTTTPTAKFNVSGNAVISGNATVTGTIAGTISTASQPNITQTGTLATLNVTGALKGADSLFITSTINVGVSPNIRSSRLVLYDGVMTGKSNSIGLFFNGGSAGDGSTIAFKNKSGTQKAIITGLQETGGGGSLYLGGTHSSNMGALIQSGKVAVGGVNFTNGLSCLQRAFNVIGDAQITGNAYVTGTHQAGNLQLGTNTLSSLSGAVNVTPLSGQGANITTTGTAGFAVNSSVLYVSTKNVCIGTTSQVNNTLYPLNIQTNSSESNIALTNATSTGTSRLLLSCTGGATRSGQIIAYAESASDTIDSISEAKSLRIDSSGGNIFLTTQSAANLYWVPNSSVKTIFTSTGRIGVGTLVPDRAISISYAPVTEGDAKCSMSIYDSTAYAAGVGGGLALGGYYDGSNATTGGYIRAIKSNGTSGDYSFDVGIGTRTTGSTPLEAIRIKNSGLVGIKTTSPQRTLSVVGDLQVTGNIYTTNESYAELYVSYNTTVTAVTTANAYATVTANVLQDDLKNFTFTSSATDKYITCGVAGTYMFVLSLSFSGGNNDEFHGGISINNQRPSGKHEFSRKMGASGDVGSASTCGIVTLAVSDAIRVQITNATDADDPTIKNMNFSIRRIYP